MLNSILKQAQNECSGFMSSTINKTNTAPESSPPAYQLSLLLFIILGAISALTPLAIDLYLPAMPSIALELSVSPGAVQFTLTAYTLSFALGQLVHGPLADSFGRKPVLLIGISIFTLAAVLSAISTDIHSLIWVRAGQGFAGAASAVVVQALVRDLFEKEDFARTMSFIILVMTIAPLLAPLMGGYVAHWFGWRAIFWLLAAIAVVILIAASWTIPETLKPEKRQAFSLSRVARNYWALFSSTQALALILTSAFSFAGMFAFITAGAFIYIEIYQVKLEHVGYLFGLNILLMMVMTSTNGRLVKKQGSHWMMNFGLSLQFSAALALVLAQFADLGLWGTVIPVMLFVSTIPVIGSNAMALLLSDYPHIAGTAASLAGTFRFATGALIAAIIALLPTSSAWPMAITMMLCSMLAISIYRIFVKK